MICLHLNKADHPQRLAIPASLATIWSHGFLRVPLFCWSRVRPHGLFGCFQPCVAINEDGASPPEWTHVIRVTDEEQARRDSRAPDEGQAAHELQSPDEPQAGHEPLALDEPQAGHEPQVLDEELAGHEPQVPDGEPAAHELQSPDEERSPGGPQAEVRSGGAEWAGHELQSSDEKRAASGREAPDGPQSAYLT